MLSGLVAITVLLHLMIVISKPTGFICCSFGQSSSALKLVDLF
jgi:hypothetical protein